MIATRTERRPRLLQGWRIVASLCVLVALQSGAVGFLWRLASPTVRTGGLPQSGLGNLWRGTLPQGVSWSPNIVREPGMIYIRTGDWVCVLTV